MPNDLDKPITVDELRELIDGLPGNMTIVPRWVGEPPSDHDPGVEFHGFKVIDNQLAILVDLFYLNGEDEPDDEDDEDE